MESKNCWTVLLLLLYGLLMETSAQETKSVPEELPNASVERVFLYRPLVKRPTQRRTYTTVLSVDGLGLRCMIPAMVAIEVESSIKRYLLAHPEYLPDDGAITTVDDFDIQLADYFDVMTGVSCGTWVTGYLASKGGNGTASRVLEDPRIVQRYGRILPGQARGLEVFFTEYGPTFYPDGLNFNLNQRATTEGVFEFPTPPFNFNQASLTDPNRRPLISLIQIPGVTSPTYSVEGLELALDLFLGDTKLSDLSTYYLSYVYDLIRRQTISFVHDTTSDLHHRTFTSHGVIRNEPRVFPETNGGETVDVQPDRTVQSSLDFYMKDVLRAGSASPALYPAKELSPIGRDDIMYSLIDGFMAGSNPSLHALIQLSAQPSLIPITEIAMLSLGSGVALQQLEERADGSALGWLANNALLGITTEGSAENIQSQVDYMFYGNPYVRPGQYLRVQTTKETDEANGEAFTRATEPEDIPIYTRVGRRTSRRYREAIDHFVEHFIFG